MTKPKPAPEFMKPHVFRGSDTIPMWLETADDYIARIERERAAKASSR